MFPKRCPVIEKGDSLREMAEEFLMYKEKERYKVRVKLIYPKWPKLSRQTEFHLPPHGPVCFAATVPDDVELSFCDENVEELDFAEKVDLVAISAMLTCQIPRGWEIADIYRASGTPVIFGGIGTMLHSEETLAACGCGLPR